MGEPAEMSVVDREITKIAAHEIVANVRDDIAGPYRTLEHVATSHGVPVQTLLLWLAQEIVRTDDHT